MNLITLMKPGVPKRMLLFIAAAAWTLAGGFLLFRGISMLVLNRDFFWLKILAGLGGGGLFYWLLFSRISYRHAQRILRLRHERPCLFSFFNIHSYIIMAVMITTGILLRKSGIVPGDYLTVLYIIMGIPLFLSAFRFYYYGIYYHVTTAALEPGQPDHPGHDSGKP